MAGDTRTIRVPDELWSEALDKAKAADTTVSQLVRSWLRFYVADVYYHEEVLDVGHDAARDGARPTKTGS